MNVKEIEALVEKVRKLQKDSRYTTAFRVAAVEAEVALLKMQIELMRNGFRDDESDGM